MKVVITKFKRIENLELPIPCSITGGNGMNKSTALEAISFVLTGKNLDGKEFEQVYDNRVDLHDAIADVSFFDNYGNEWQRIVKPIFQTNRQGIEEIKIKRSTECRKNGIVVNDFSDEFQDFYKYGTDYFFNQKEDVQRSIFIDILKSKLPEYDVNSASLKLKELKRSQKIEVDLVKDLQNANKNTKDVPVPEIPEDIQRLNSEFLSLSAVDNSHQVAETNRKNNQAMSLYFEKKKELSGAISSIELSIERTKSNIEAEKEKLLVLENSHSVPKTIQDTAVFEEKVALLTEKLNDTPFYANLEDYAELNFGKNPVLVENSAKIKEISEREFAPSGEISDKCHLSGAVCETAKQHSEKALKQRFYLDNQTVIADLRTKNRSILEKEMSEANRLYNAVKSDLQEWERLLNKVIDSNSKIDAENETLKSEHDAKILFEKEQCNKNIERLNAGLDELSEQLSTKQSELSALTEPVPEKLPESVEISDELKKAHADFEALKVDINKAIGVNENNAKIIDEREKQIKEKQANLLEIGQKIVTLTQEISDYFSNLSDIVKQEFAGDIEIDVELLEYVMSRDEYKDCFKITANGNVFPYECNGALLNNVKMQILFNLQRLVGYKGVTVMDNCEANTTQPINTLGMNCVLAYATLDKELIIK